MKHLRLILEALPKDPPCSLTDSTTMTSRRSKLRDLTSLP